MLSLTDLSRLATDYPDALAAQVREFPVGSRRLEFNTRPAIMGVINLSADSWYRESVCLNLDMAVRRLETLRAQGAEVIDVGVESTLPHAARASAQKQQSLVLPLLAEARKRKIPISVETYSKPVARKCLAAGAAVINLTRGAGSRDIFELVAKHQAAVVLCYVQGRHVRAVDELKFAADPMAVMYEYFARSGGGVRRPQDFHRSRPGLLLPQSAGLGGTSAAPDADLSPVLSFEAAGPPDLSGPAPCVRVFCGGREVRGTVLRRAGGARRDAPVPDP
jgi:methylmalonyl-CoA mutase cobalamin-binding subunit